MRLIAHRKGSLDAVNRKRAYSGLNFEYTGSYNDLVWEYDYPTKSPSYQRDVAYKTLQQRKALSKC